MDGLGGALCFIVIITSSFLVTEVYTIPRYFSKTVAAYSPVRLKYEKNNQSTSWPVKYGTRWISILQRYLVTVVL